eukprot:TRINITY_DN93906_c0_g1_i1.p1 TRINITY_DN93906_c0_g1~~TRINITY_DN93906_c0_g1_i1.p1  ORF type:complete len:576 (+),score=112.10 TRINITY_DN93906_c0_g1_i1:65-1792(+)
MPSMSYYNNPSAKSEPWPADEWVKRPRYGEMWIHGKTNWETPPPVLDSEGFITPTELFFVRQHSEVPKVLADGANPDDHSFFIEQVTHDAKGEKTVMKSTKLTLRQLKEDFDKHSVTSMMSCSGQRRYEQNLVEKTGGAISWHNAVGNATFSGALLRDVLLHLGVSMDLKISKYVEFHGKEGYRSCIPFRKAMDPFGETLVCYEMNGEALHPDHGQPLRLVVPGYSAKCSAKWLTGISVRDIDCDHGKHKGYYKLYPASMRPGTEEYKLHHQDPEYTLGELNVNSCIFQPHSCTSVAKEAGPLLVTGYAHTGGGRALARIEVSGNGGKTWEQVRPLEQQLTDAGNLWAWVRFSHTLSHFDPAADDAEIVVRAWDCAANTQPDWPQWNYTGMLNNHLYRVKVKATDNENKVFVHPAQWMDPQFVPFAADEVAPEPVLHDMNRQDIIEGAWCMGKFVDSTVCLCADNRDEVESEEFRWAGKKLEGKVCRGSNGELEILADFFGFNVRGVVCETQGQYLLCWTNGMRWAKDTSVKPKRRERQYSEDSTAIGGSSSGGTPELKPLKQTPSPTGPAPVSI